MLLVLPLLFMLVFGAALSGEIKNVPIVIDIQDEGAEPLPGVEINLAEEIVEIMKEDDRVLILEESYESGIDRVETSDYYASILFDKNFSQLLIEEQSGEITVYIDSTKPGMKASIYGALNDALQELMDDLLAGQGIKLNETNAYGGVELSGLDTSVPMVMGYILSFLIIIISIIIAIREDVGHTKARLFSTPLSPMERILGYVLCLSFFAVLETSIVISIAIFIFGSTVQGSIWLLFGTAYLFGIVHILLAFLLSNFAKNELQSVQMAVLVAIPSLAISGMLIPIPSLPPAIQLLSKIVPLTYGIVVFEGIMLKGWGVEHLTYELTLLAVLAVVLFILTLITSRDYSKD
jgi:ABC-2 type transport system permease protein